jgi:hypothetical protein
VLVDHDRGADRPQRLPPRPSCRPQSRDYCITRDHDIVPDPDRENLVRLVRLLAEIDAEHAGIGDFSTDEFAFDPLHPDQLAQGENFRLSTSLGPVDVTQWIAGIDLIPRSRRSREAIKVTLPMRQLLVAGFDDLRAMKLAAGGEQASLTFVNSSSDAAEGPRSPEFSRSRGISARFTVLSNLVA